MNPILIGAGMAAGNTLLNGLGMSMQSESSKDLMDYQWQNFMSPKAQVNAMAQAGLNPASLLGEGKGSFASPSVAMPSSIPVQLGGVDTLANYLVAKSQAKKNDVDTRLSDIEAQNKQFELDLAKTFSSKERVANLLSAYKALQLQDDEHSRNEWTIAKEKALSELSGIQKDTAQKVLDNMDTQIQQENKQREEGIKLTQEKQKTEKSSQSANYASANASNTQASVNREMARYQRVIADVEESSSPFKLENLLRHYAASNMISDADYQEAYRRYERLKSINADNDKHEWNKALDAFMFYLEEHVKGLSPFVSAATTNYSTK